MSTAPDRVAERPERRLLPLYYLHNFRFALATLKARYAGLLSGAETDFIDRFDGLSEPAQCLLTRLVMRKGPLFRRVTLQYTEVPDLGTVLAELAAPGWLDVDPQLSAHDLSGVLSSDELRLAVGIRRGRQLRVLPPAIQGSQLALPLPDQPTVHRSLAAWNGRLAGSVVRLCVESLIRRLQLLFFGNDHQSWAEFVLSDLGVKRYETVALDADARAFHSREEIEHFYRLNDCRARLEAGESPCAVREAAGIPDAASSWLRARFMRLQVRLGELFEHEGNLDLALQTYRDSGAAEGLVRAVRLQIRSGLPEGAQRDALAAKALPCSEAQHEAIARALTRTRRRPDDRPQVIELRLPKPAERQRVELAVVEQLGATDSPMFYVENSLLTSLFGLLCWDALFAPVQGAFFHPFQTAPADLHTPEFRGRRALQFQELLGLLDTGEHEAVIWRLYRAKAGIRSHFVHWSRLRPSVLRLALDCIPAPHLKLCFERLLDDLKDNVTGLPDLIQFWPAERRYRLIEVKGPGDRLQHNQRRWLRFFARNDIPAAVCQVQWHAD